jgi:DNA polymerase delta subunit 2
MDSTPDLYIVGGQPKFGTKLVKEKIEGNGEARCRLVLVPSFSATGTIVLVNLRTLEVRTITFKVSESLVGPPPDPNISTFPFFLLLFSFSLALNAAEPMKRPLTPEPMEEYEIVVEE